jgi:hypothetical protein
MAGKQLKTYCRILDYVEAADPEMAEIIHASCVESSLTNMKNKPGITFLIPQDKALRTKLSNLIYSDKIEESTKVCDILNAHIIRDVFKSPAEWKSREVANSIYPPQIVEVESASAKEIVFKSGAKAVLDPNFKDSSQRQNLAVWLLTGELPVTKDKPAQKHNKPRAKTGGYDPGRLQTQSERFKIGLAVENAYALCRLQCDSLNTKQHRDVYLEHSMSLINYIMNVRNDTALMHEKVLPLISLDKLDFYLLVEPHNATGSYLLDDNLIHEWWFDRQNHPCDCGAVLTRIEQLLASGTGALVYTNRALIAEKIADLRQQFNEQIDARPRSAVEEIAKIYEEFEDNNSINGTGPILPAELARYYSNNKGLKMMQDELRFITYGMFKRLESEAFDIGAFHMLVNMIGECLHAKTPEARASCHKLLNKNTMRYHISAISYVQEIKIFVFSTMFLYTPMTRMEAQNLKFKHSVTRPDPSRMVVYNIAKDLYARHHRLVSTDQVPKDLIAALRSLDTESIDPALRDELKKKFA